MRNVHLVALLVLASALPAANVAAQSTPALGVRAGLSRGPDDVYLGMQTELGRAFDQMRWAPSLDLSLSDDPAVTINGDLRLYLMRLPETGLRFYGQIGPALTLAGDEGFGLNLTAGLHVPMKSGRRYNVEVRFGFGDVPELKVGASVVFAL